MHLLKDGGDGNQNILRFSNLSVLSAIYVRQYTIWTDIHIGLHPGIAGPSEIIIQGRIVSAAENNKNR